MTDHDPTADHVAQVAIETMWARDAASQALGMRLVSVGPGTAEVSMTVRADMLNGWGTCHGGLIAALADSAFAVACNSRGEIVVGSGFDVSFLEPVHAGDDLVARARETALRGRSGLYDVSVLRVADARVVAELRGRSRSTGRSNPGLT